MCRGLPRFRQPGRPWINCSGGWRFELVFVPAPPKCQANPFCKGLVTHWTLYLILCFMRFAWRLFWHQILTYCTNTWPLLCRASLQWFTRSKTTRFEKISGTPNITSSKQAVLKGPPQDLMRNDYCFRRLSIPNWIKATLYCKSDVFSISGYCMLIVNVPNQIAILIPCLFRNTSIWACLFYRIASYLQLSSSVT